MVNKKGFSVVKIVLIGLLIPVLVLVVAAWAYQASLSSAPQPLLHSAILTSTTSTPSQVNNSSTWQRYNDNSGNFSILYPNEYQVQNLNSQLNVGQADIYLGSSTTIPLLAISYLPASATSTPQTALNITKSNLDTLEKHNSSMSYITGTTTIAGFPTQAIFTSDTGSEDGAQYIFQAQGTIYSISVLYSTNSPQKTIEDNKTLAANIIATFKVVPPLAMASHTGWQSYSPMDTSGGETINLGSGNSVEIPQAAFNKKETIAASFNRQPLPQAPNRYFVSLGNSVSLSLSDPLMPLPVPFPPRQIAESQGKFVTSTMMKFVFNAGISEAEFIKDAIPTIDVIGTDNSSIFLAMFTTSTFDTSTNQAVIYVDPAIFQLPSPTSTVRIKSIIVGMVGIGA